MHKYWKQLKESTVLQLRFGNSAVLVVTRYDHRTGWWRLGRGKDRGGKVKASGTRKATHSTPGQEQNAAFP